MSDAPKAKETAVISTRTEPETRQRIDEESQLRGHTRSQALEQIIKLGLPHYLRRFPKKYERIDSAA
jgi:hypothetical protein